jgi:hypothetical protein
MSTKNIIIHKEETEFKTYADEIKAGVIFRFRDGVDTFIKLSTQEIASLENGNKFGAINHGEISIITDEFTVKPNYKID